MKSVLESQVSGGIAARECLGLLRDEIPPGDTAAARGAAHAVEAWHRAWCVEWGLAPPVNSTTPSALGDEEIREFEKQPMRFGKFAGKPIGEVPLQYLDWLLGEYESFARKLCAYLRRWGDECQEECE